MRYSQSQQYLTYEIKIINQIANIHSLLGDNKKAADIFYQLLKYVRRHYRETIVSTGVLPLILYNYARVLDLCGRYEEGAQLALEGKDACIRYGHFQKLSGCLEIYAECCHFLGNNKESAKAYRQALQDHPALLGLRHGFLLKSPYRFVFLKNNTER